MLLKHSTSEYHHTTSYKYITLAEKQQQYHTGMLRIHQYAHQAGIWHIGRAPAGHGSSEPGETHHRPLPRLQNIRDQSQLSWQNGAMHSRYTRHSL